MVVIKVMNESSDGNDDDDSGGFSRMVVLAMTIVVGWNSSNDNSDDDDNVLKSRPTQPIELVWLRLKSLTESSCLSDWSSVKLSVTQSSLQLVEWLTDLGRVTPKERNTLGVN